MAIWTLAKKDLLLLLRDVRALLILVAMPLLFILLLGTLLGESFGQKPDDRIRIMIVDLDNQGPFFQQRSEIGGVLASAPRGPVQVLPSLALPPDTPWPGLVRSRTWSEEVRNDLKDTAGIRLEILDSREEAERLVREHKQAAVLVFEPGFSDTICHCSFLADGINPFYRDGVRIKVGKNQEEAERSVEEQETPTPNQEGAAAPVHRLEHLDATLLVDGRQPGQAAIIQQVAQVSLMRVLLPYMIGKAFDRLSEPEFIELLGNKVRLPVPGGAEFLFTLKGIPLNGGKASLNDALLVAAPDARTLGEYREKVGEGVQDALRQQFSKYDLTGKTWDRLTRARDEPRGGSGTVTKHVDAGGTGPFHFGAQRYQLLVPSYTVMFAFFLVVMVGWLFVAERRQGTLKRLRAAPITRGQVLLGKLLPCFLLSLGQGLLLLVAGRLVFGMRWGPGNWPLTQQVLWLLPVVVTTSLAATGLAMLVAALARTEIQVALYGAVPVLALALIGGCVLPPEMMPEQTKWLTLVTPQGWALEAYRELLDPDPTAIPNLTIVLQSCGVLALFGVLFTVLAWWRLRLD